MMKLIKASLENVSGSALLAFDIYGWPRFRKRGD